MTDTDPIIAFGATLTTWWARAKRDFPWRHTREPWPVLVAEVMLAQTQAQRVAKVFPQFLARFPDPRALATAPTPELLTAWSGLGYNRRALRLRELAQMVVAMHGGHVPRSGAELEALPGIGHTIAAAVAAQAFAEPVLPLDVNVRRVLRRALLPSGNDRELTHTGTRLAQLADPWTIVQASFDFGALVCKATPRCHDCPWRPRCAWDHRCPDPARPRARQSTFAGSHRQLRGQIVAALARGEREPESILADLGVASERFWHAWNQLVEEGFV